MDEKSTVYLETTIPSYLTGWPSNDLVLAGKQVVTRRWWESRRHHYKLAVSQFVIDEASAGDSSAANKRLSVLEQIPLLEIDEAVLDLAGFGSPVICTPDELFGSNEDEN